MSVAGVTLGSEAAMCTGKRSFASYALAAEVSGRKRRRAHLGAHEPYRCLHCRQWHIGTHKQRARHTGARRNAG